MGTLFSLSKSATSIALDTSEIVLLLFGILLTVGLIGEYAKSDRWKRHVKTFEMLVIIGVAGELLADGGIFLFSSHLQTIADQEIGDLAIVAHNAKVSADGAADSAARAEASAKTADVDAGKALDKSNAANNAAGAAQEKTGEVAKQADELRDDLQSAKTKLEAVDAKRAELEKSLINLAVCNAPRVLRIWTMREGKTTADPLKPFAGYQAIIQFVPDAEARRAALYITGALRQTGWKVPDPVSVPLDGIEDGVNVEPFVGMTDDSIYAARIRISEAADAVVDFLHSYNWQAKSGFMLDKKSAPQEALLFVALEGLRIRVGLYPPPFVVPPAEKDIAAAIAQTEEAQEKASQQNDQERLNREEQYLTTLPPQEATEFDARWKGWERDAQEREKKWNERYKGPCKALNPFLPTLR